ncbi:unnamed protein product [Orchesella dallaii]|uniref:Ionotropic glutamate receptor C-terminal domain-containing protein n=1 Tax=Orchesella dallaii TaxID=48710 RepID=A0ABP1RT99_9HEXA
MKSLLLIVKQILLESLNLNSSKNSDKMNFMFVKLWLLACYWPSYLTAEPQSLPSPPLPHKAVSVLSTIVTENFHSCDLYLTDDDNSNKKSSQSLFTELESASLSSSPSKSPPRFLLNLHSYFHHVSWNSSICSDFSCFKAPLRKYSQCSLAIGLFTQGLQKLPIFLELLVFPFQSPVKNELDYFIFVAHSPKLNSILEHRNLSKVKYKLGIPLDLTSNSPSSSNEVVGTSVCFYCNKGDPQFMPIPVEKPHSLSDLFPDYTLNGFGHTLRGSVPLKYPWLYEIKQINGKWKPIRGVYAGMVDNLLAHLNFTFTVFPSTGHGSGIRFPNGTWNGVMGDMLYDVADFGASSSNNYGRYPLVSFTNAIVYIYISFFMGPPRISYTWKAIYWPFTPELWFSVVMSLLVVLLTFKLMQLENNPVKETSLLFRRHLVEYISFTLIGQGLEYPNGISARLLLTVWLFSALIINTLYVSMIVGLLAFPLYQQQPMTFKELVQSGDFSWGFDMSRGSLFAHFKTSSNPTFREIFEQKEAERESEECLKQAMQRNFACVTWDGVAKYIAFRNLSLIHGKSPLVYANEITLFVASGLAVPRRNVYKANFHWILGTLHDTGHSEKWEKDDMETLRKNKVHWEQSMNITKESEDDGPDLLSLSNLLGVFYCYFVGHVAALLMFLMEFVKYSRSRRKEKGLKKNDKDGGYDDDGNDESLYHVAISIVPELSLKVPITKRNNKSASVGSSSGSGDVRRIDALTPSIPTRSTSIESISPPMKSGSALWRKAFSFSINRR